MAAPFRRRKRPTLRSGNLLRRPRNPRRIINTHISRNHQRGDINPGQHVAPVGERMVDQQRGRVLVAHFPVLGEHKVVVGLGDGRGEHALDKGGELGGDVFGELVGLGWGEERGGEGFGFEFGPGGVCDEDGGLVDEGEVVDSLALFGVLVPECPGDR